jgi:hypothetical protein
MARAPEEGEEGEPTAPIRTAGITPAAAAAERREG